MYINWCLKVYCLLLLILQLSNGENIKTTNSRRNIFSSGQECGIDTKNNVNDHTWLVRLRYENAAYGCGGVLLNKRYILTAASCLIGDIVQHLGEFQIITIFENTGDHLGKDYEFEETIIHPNFVPNVIHGENDIALIRLANDISNSTIPICTDGNDAVDPSREVPHVAGWGQTYAGQKTNIRKILNVKFVNKTACDKLLSPYQYVVTARDVCVTLDENDYDRPCPVDGGGILVYRVNLRWWLIGIGSFNAVCGYHERPGVFTKFHEIFAWIENNIRT